MAHYAFINDDNIVTQVIAGRDEDEIVDGISDWEAHYGEVMGMRCLRTSINGNIRANFAGVGAYYDESNDVFIPPKPGDGWVLGEDFRWQPPVDN